MSDNETRREGASGDEMNRATLNMYRRAVMRGHLTDSEFAERYLLETLYEIVQEAVHRHDRAEAQLGGASVPAGRA